MGCLLEFFMEFIFEIAVEAIGCAYIKLVTLILPRHTFSPRFRKRLDNTVTIVFDLLGVVLIVGACFLVQKDQLFHRIGQFITFIPLALIGVQVLAGIIVKVFRIRF